MEAVDLNPKSSNHIPMAFNNVLLFILVCYVIYYAVNIGYDVFLRREAEEIIPKMDEEEVDISDLAQTFQPVSILKDEPTPRWDDNTSDEENRVMEAGETEEETIKTEDIQQQENDSYHEVMLMTGAIEMEDLVPMVNDYAENGVNSVLGEIIGDWEHF